MNYGCSLSQYITIDEWKTNTPLTLLEETSGNVIGRQQIIGKKTCNKSCFSIWKKNIKRALHCYLHLFLLKISRSRSWNCYGESMWENKYSITIPRGAFYVLSTVAKRFLFICSMINFHKQINVKHGSKNTETSSG